MQYLATKSPYQINNKKFKSFLFLALFGAVYLVLNAAYTRAPLKPTAADRRYDQIEDVYWRFEEKYRNILLNLRHRADFVDDKLKAMYSQNRHFTGIQSFSDAASKLMETHRKRTNLFVQFCEKVLLFNKFKDAKLDEIKRRIHDRINRLQNTKCHVSKVLACSLEQDCGYACLFHHIGVCLILSYYTERTLVIIKTDKKGIGNFTQVFWPVTNSCKFDQQDLEEIKRQSFRPLVLVQQEENGRSGFLQYEKDIKEIAKYHSEPIGFFNAQLLSYILRFNESSSFYQTLLDAKARFKITNPYVGIHVRRSDKANEADFYEPEDYMRHVDLFYDRYFRDHPDRVNTTQRTVYVASDETTIFPILKSKYPNYTFHYNNSFTLIAGSVHTRYSREGFESLLFDVFFLSNSDFVVCTFSSNVCRLSYELLLARSHDYTRHFHSLDTPYYHISDAKFFKMGILPNHVENDPTKELRKGDLFHRRVVSGHDYEEYHQNGFHCGWNYRTKFREPFPSYKLKSVYF